MSNKKIFKVLISIMVAALLMAACAPAAAEEPVMEEEEAAAPVVEEAAAEPAAEEAAAPEDYIFGILMVGVYNNKGWDQAHYDAGLYVEEQIPGTSMIYIDKVNVADRPGTTSAQLAEELVSKGANLVIFNSDDMKDGAVEFAAAHPDVKVIYSTGDTQWAEGENYQELANMKNIMGKMEYGKMIAGCAAALTSETGKIGYLGPLINEETRRLTSSAYLGAQYCWENYAGKDPADLTFEVNWIGFWFNIPGVTSDPSQVTDDFFNSGYDVVISGIDTTEALVEAKKFADGGDAVYAIPYDYKGACEQAPEICLGVPYFNWGPSYKAAIQEAMDGTWTNTWEWLDPDWTDINNPDTSMIGFVKGDALSADNAAMVDDFIAELAGGLNLWTGPMNLQDGTEFLADGVTATDQQIWYLPQLLEGMLGLSSAAE
jgi:simple sugar transport system substrate-binding protein